jgi:hypothetical protein
MPVSYLSKPWEISHRVAEPGHSFAAAVSVGSESAFRATRRTLVAMGWFERAKKATAGQRVTRADKRQATAVVDELNALNAERDRLTRDGLAGVATITAIGQNVATTALGTWHELILEVQLPDRDPYRATRRVSIELSTSPHIRIGAKLPVRVDPQDSSKVLVIASP